MQDCDLESVGTCSDPWFSSVVSPARCRHPGYQLQHLTAVIGLVMTDPSLPSRCAAGSSVICTHCCQGGAASQGVMDAALWPRRASVKAVCRPGDPQEARAAPPPVAVGNAPKPFPLAARAAPPVGPSPMTTAGVVGSDRAPRVVAEGGSQKAGRRPPG